MSPVVVHSFDGETLSLGGARATPKDLFVVACRHYDKWSKAWDGYRNRMRRYHSEQTVWRSMLTETDVERK